MVIHFEMGCGAPAVTILRRHMQLAADGGVEVGLVEADQMAEIATMWRR